MNDLVGFLGAAYPWVKAAHVTFVIFWMAGLFLVPRFYVYHHATTPGSAEDRAWTEREDRARNIILMPAMLVVWILGLMLAFNIGAFQLAQGMRPLENRTLRIMNEIPGIAAALIVVLAIVRPF